MTNDLLLGFGRCDFTPDGPVAMNSRQISDEVIDHIYVTCLAWKDTNTTVLQFSMDLRNIYDPQYDFVAPHLSKALGIPQEQLLISVTHNHSAPDISLQDREDIKDWTYRIGLPAMCQAGKDALADLSPVTGAVSGISITEKLNFVRRYQRADGTWYGIACPMTDAPLVRAENKADPELRAVRISRSSKKDIIMINFQTHAATGQGNFPFKVHADFVGPLRRVVENSEDALAVYFQGACGNVNCNARLPEDKKGWPDDCFKIGEAMGQKVLEALAHAKPLQLGSLKLINHKLTRQVNHSKSHLADQARIIKAETDPEKKQKLMNDAGITNIYEVSAIIKRSCFGETREMPLSTLSCGELAFGFAPVELFDTCGKAFRDASPFDTTFFCGYTNGSHSYMPSAHAFPHKGYEVMECHYVPGTGELIVLELLRQLKVMKGI